jgi:hypothetical protein
MKKAILSLFPLFLTACSTQNTPDFILKYTNSQTFKQKQIEKQCQNYVSSRIIKTDGVIDYYQYTSNNLNACVNAKTQNLKPTQKPERYLKTRGDVSPLAN